MHYNHSLGKHICLSLFQRQPQCAVLNVWIRGQNPAQSQNTQRRVYLQVRRLEIARLSDQISHSQRIYQN